MQPQRRKSDHETMQQFHRDTIWLFRNGSTFQEYFHYSQRKMSLTKSVKIRLMFRYII
jgi:hypothetical protein